MVFNSLNPLNPLQPQFSIGADRVGRAGSFLQITI